MFSLAKYAVSPTIRGSLARFAHRILLLLLAALIPARLSAQIPERVLRQWQAEGCLQTLNSERHDVFISVGAESLEASYFIPALPAPDSLGYPGMLFVPGFGEGMDSDTLDASLWAGSGYFTLCYSPRGQGRSGGRSTIMGRAERQDLSCVLEFLRKLPGVNPSRVGIQGGSQGGLHVLWAIADSLPVIAGSADVISPTWASDLLGNGSVHTTLAFLLRTPDVRYDSTRDTFWKLLRDDDEDALLERFPAGRDLDTTALARSRVPLVLFAKWQDHYFSPRGALECFQAHRGLKRIYLGTGGHYSDDFLPELHYQWDLLNSWMECFVLGRSNGITEEPPATVATSSLPVDAENFFSWSHQEVAAWPGGGPAPYRLYLRRDSLLSPYPGVESDSLVLRNDWRSGYTLDSAYEDGFHGARFRWHCPQSSFTFTSPPLQEDILWSGSPRFHFFLRSSSTEFPLHVQIYEVEPGGEERLINRINLTVRHWQPGTAGDLESAGGLDSHRFTRGSRIRIEVTNIDQETRDGWGTAPFVLPLFRRASATLVYGSDHQGFIEFPFVGAPHLATEITGLHAVYDHVGSRVILEWRTLVEVNNAGFWILRSRQGGAESPVGFLPPQAGPMSDSPLQYVFADSGVSLGTWVYRIRQMDLDSLAQTTPEVTVEATTTGVERDRPLVLKLNQNYPNPFNPVTTISFSLPEPLRVELSIYTLLGQKVERLVDAVLPPGVYSLRWDASPVPSGVYLYRMTTGGRSLVRRMMLVK